MSNTQIDVSGMKAAAQNILTTVGGTRSEKNGVEASMAMLRSTWKGEAATAFDGAMQEFYAECDKIIQTLEALSEKIGVSAQSYQVTADTNTDLARGLSARLSNF